MKNSRNYIMHDFYCINCGKKGIPIFRKGNHMRAKGHRKLMYCPNCKHTVNHVECYSDDEVKQFLSDFARGSYIEESRSELEFEDSKMKRGEVITA